jgi:chloride channel 2
MSNTLKIDAASTIGSVNTNGDDSDDDKSAMGYQQTLMYGRYSKSLGDYAKEESKRQKILDKRRRKQTARRTAELTGEKSHGKAYRTTTKIITYVWKHTFAKLGEDWVFLAVLGIVMAVISFIMDYGIDQCGASRKKIFNVVKEQNYHVIVQFLAWCILPVFLVLFAAGFVHIVAPQAIGSGIPEMKTIMRGVVLKVIILKV